MEDTVRKFFMVIPRVAFNILREDHADLDFSEDNLQTEDYTLVCLEEDQVEFYKDRLMEIGTANDLSVFAQLIVTYIPSQASLPAWVDYPKFVHEYMWGMIRSRNAVETFKSQDRVAGMLKNSPLAALIGALASSLASIEQSDEEEDDDEGPCDNPSCPFCHPETAFASSETDSEPNSEETPKKADTQFVQGVQGSSDTFFVNGSRSIH